MRARTDAPDGGIRPCAHTDDFSDSGKRSVAGMIPHKIARMWEKGDRPLNARPLNARVLANLVAHRENGSFPMIGKKFSNGWKILVDFSNDWKKFSRVSSDWKSFLQERRFF
jgi:hypothetical protein